MSCRRLRVYNEIFLQINEECDQATQPTEQPNDPEPIDAPAPEPVDAPGPEPLQPEQMTVSQLASLVHGHAFSGPEPTGAFDYDAFAFQPRVWAKSTCKCTLFIYCIASDSDTTFQVHYLVMMNWLATPCCLVGLIDVVLCTKAQAQLLDIILWWMFR